MDRFPNQSLFQVPVCSRNNRWTLNKQWQRQYPGCYERKWRRSVGGWDKQQFSALPIEYYTYLSRLERCKGVISSMTFPRWKWPQRWFILPSEANPSRQSLLPIFLRTKSKVPLCLHVHFYSLFVGLLWRALVTGFILMQTCFYSNGSFIRNNNCNCMIVEGNICNVLSVWHIGWSFMYIVLCNAFPISLLFQSLFDL